MKLWWGMPAFRRTVSSLIMQNVVKCYDTRLKILFTLPVTCDCLSEATALICDRADIGGSTPSFDKPRHDSFGVGLVHDNYSILLINQD